MSSSSSPQVIVEYQHQQERSMASPKIYDAFISHRGPDVKDTLAIQLYDLLKARECRPFLDREEMEGGDSITSAIHNAICSSVVQIAIFSKRYAESSWCLDELVLMLQQTDALFIPVFYDVQPWELRHIDNQRSQYAAAFSDYQSKRRNLDKLDKWKSSLEFASKISGYEHSKHKDNLCEEIVSRVLKEMKKRIPLHVAKYPVGLAELVHDFESSCSEAPRDKVRIVGICGIGGSGKTTMAKELFNMKRSGYHASCFLSDVRESHGKGELVCLQSQLLQDLFSNVPKITSVDDGIGKLKDSLRREQKSHFLIVLDDIDHHDQLDALLFEDKLRPPSLVIITTRDQSMLIGADISYKMKTLNRDHAKDLFCKHAFCGRDPPVAYKNLVESFVKFCGGLPLSLKVLGAHVYGRDERYWELELEKVKNIQPKDITQRLKISFDGLDSHEKQIFIDIACFFNKKAVPQIKRAAISIWNAYGWSAEHAVQTLEDKCLIEIVGRNNFQHFEMHDHLGDLGRQMADEFRPPRLWRPHILRSMEAKEFKQILAETKGRCLHSFHFLDSSHRAKITYFIGNLNDSAETELLWLDIDKGFGNLKNIPSWIPLRQLRCLAVSAMEELWSNFQQQMQTNAQASFELRMLKIVGSPSLHNLPDLIGIFNHLEELYIERSLEKTDITSFVQSLKQLRNLRSLELSGGGVSFSGNLNLSNGRDSTNFEVSTSSRMDNLESIGIFNFAYIPKLLVSGEICPRLRSLKVEDMGNLNKIDLKQLERLNTLKVKLCPKLEAISGLSCLTGLQSLKVGECYKLETISGLSCLTGLQSLKVGECYKLETISGLSCLAGLQSLRLAYCSKLETISRLSFLTGLQSLNVWTCTKLETISELSSLTGLQSLKVGYCPKLETISELSFLRGLQSLEVGYCSKLETISGLSSLTGLQSFTVWRCPKLETISGLPSLTGQGLRSLVIDVPHNGDASFWNCINGLKTLPSEYTILRWKPVNAVSSTLDVKLFSEVIGAQAITETERGWTFQGMRSSSSANTIYASIVRGYCLPFFDGYKGEWMVLALFRAHDGYSYNAGSVTIVKGFKATVNKGEEGKAFSVLQRIVNRSFGQSMVRKRKLAADECD